MQTNSQFSIRLYSRTHFNGCCVSIQSSNLILQHFLWISKESDQLVLETVIARKGRSLGSLTGQQRPTGAINPNLDPIAIH
jgi:hypothetical protein